jgi:hypothetical protein
MDRQALLMEYLKVEVLKGKRTALALIPSAC